MNTTGLVSLIERYSRSKDHAVKTRNIPITNKFSWKALLRLL